jgi:hypothetical protein
LDTEQARAPSILDRAAGCFVAVLSVGITILVLPMVLAAKAVVPISAARLYSVPLLVWAGLVSLIAGFIGLRLGTLKVIELLGHFWGTGWPENKVLTGQLWLGTVLLGAVTFILAYL